MSNVVKRSTQMDSQRLHLDTLITVLYCWSVALMTLTHWYCCCRQLLVAKTMENWKVVGKSITCTE